MPIVLTFDIENAGSLERNRIQSGFERLGWQNIGGSSYRYPRLGSKQPVEDWFNHVIPGLMLLRAYLMKSGRKLTNYTIDVQSSAGFDEAGSYGGPPVAGAAVKLLNPRNSSFGAKNLRNWLDGISYPYP